MRRFLYIFLCFIVLIFVVPLAFAKLWDSGIFDFASNWSSGLIFFGYFAILLTGIGIYQFIKGEISKKELFLILLIAPIGMPLMVLVDMLFQGAVLVVLYISIPVSITAGLYGLIKKLRT